MATDTQDTSEVKENAEAAAPQEAPTPKLSGKGMRAMQGLDGQAPVASDGVAAPKPEAVFEAKPDTFEITDWSGYPDGPKPEGPFRILEGEEYEKARTQANETNRALHKSDPAIKGLEIHEVQPVKFGGSPTDLNNKIFVTRQQHAEYTAWWNNQLKNRVTG